MKSPDSASISSGSLMSLLAFQLCGAFFLIIGEGAGIGTLMTPIAEITCLNSNTVSGTTVAVQPYF